MIEINFLVLFVSAVIPLLVGSVWYSPKFFGNMYISESGEQKTHKPSVYVIAFLLSLAYSLALAFQVIHQYHVQSIFVNEIGFHEKTGEAWLYFKNIMDIYGRNFRTWHHGMFHGFLNSLFIVLPVIGIHFMFESKSWKYILTHLGYWAICNMIMGAIICQFY